MQLNHRLEALRSRLPLFTTILCLAQPILDVISYWQREWELPNTYTMLARLFLLLGGLVIGFLLTERRWAYYLFGGLAAAYLVGHVLACLGNTGGYLDPVEDLTDQLRTLLMPLTTLTLITFLRSNDRVFPAMVRGIVLNLGLILLVELLSVLTGTDPHTYEAKAIGVRGWFIWTSPQSAILSVATPIVIAWAAGRYPNRWIPMAIACTLCFGMLFLFGTRLTFVSMGMIGLGMAISLTLGGKQHLRQAVAVLLCAAAFTALYPVSPMTRNRTAVAVNSEIKQQRVSAAAAAFGVPEDASTTDNRDALRAAYRYNLQGMIDRFGLERVAAVYGNSLDADRICDDRVMKNNFCNLLMEESAAQTPLARWFGLELNRTRQYETEVYNFEKDDWDVGEETYDPENDFSGVYYLCGAVGLALICGFLICFGVRIAFVLFRNRKTLSNPLFAAFGGAFVIALVYALDTASMLRRNNSSVYLAFILAGLWYLTREVWEERKIK